MAKVLATPNKIDVVKPQVSPRCDACRFYKKLEGADGVGNCFCNPPGPDGRLSLTRAEGFCRAFEPK